MLKGAHILKIVLVFLVVVLCSAIAFGTGFFLKDYISTQGIYSSENYQVELETEYLPVNGVYSEVITNPEVVNGESYQAIKKQFNKAFKLTNDLKGRDKESIEKVVIINLVNAKSYVCTVLDYQWNYDKPVKVVLTHKTKAISLASAEQLKEYPFYGQAGYNRIDVYINPDSLKINSISLISMIRHELVHVVQYAKIYDSRLRWRYLPFFQDKTSRWLFEGTAEYLSQANLEQISPLTNEELVEKAREIDIFNKFAYKNENINDSYYISALFVKYLKERYGKYKFARLFAPVTFQKYLELKYLGGKQYNLDAYLKVVYGKRSKGLYREWLGELENSNKE